MTQREAVRVSTFGFKFIKRSFVSTKVAVASQNGAALILGVGNVKNQKHVFCHLHLHVAGD